MTTEYPPWWHLSFRGGAKPGHFRAFGIERRMGEWLLGVGVILGMAHALLVLFAGIAFPPRTFEQYADEDIASRVQARADCVADAIGFPRVPVHLASELGGWLTPAKRVLRKVGIGPGDGGTLAYYHSREKHIVLLVKRGRADPDTLAHELAHAAHHDVAGRFEFMLEGHGREFALHHLFTFGASAHCAVTGEDPQGWDGRPLGTLYEYADGTADAGMKDEVPWRGIRLP